eukprot:TRINITY_DN18246_c0_g1_i2.p1 TRINITY_DN18246_c0_g1~~TRINITY_DN18246_c0_g1_i2.p1  ORF type:complete len:147 (-),score=17.54 TRINITY_DN18246_c0_g1_i2:84-524(-)
MGHALAAKPPRHPNHHRRVNLGTKKLVSRNFLETPPVTVLQIINDILWRINPRGKGCCHSHIKLECISRRTSELLSHPCRSFPEPDDAWQCRECFAINKGKDLEGVFCDVCDADFDCNDEQGDDQIIEQNGTSSCDADCSSSDAMF